MPLAFVPRQRDQNDTHPKAYEFASHLIAWQKEQGRHDLPWQHTQNPYRVWLSEVMLQQTQVVTVIPYYRRFIERFPTVSDLAAATEHEVLALWTGLGYYSRARHLHQCAQMVMTHHQGRFPSHSSELVTLPGIGPSTAAAIASFCFFEPISIFDGNVQRVLARWLGFDEDLSLSKAQKTLHTQAQVHAQYVEASDRPAYTQGLMDLGATVCTAKKPMCLICPLNTDCVAHQTQRTAELPVKTKRIRRQTEAWWVLILQRLDGAVYLVQRPEKGIWAKLWCFPMFADVGAFNDALNNASNTCTPASKTALLVRPLPMLTHLLTHKELCLSACVLPVAADDVQSIFNHATMGEGQWHAPQHTKHLGLPKPVVHWLSVL